MTRWQMFSEITKQNDKSYLVSSVTCYKMPAGIKLQEKTLIQSS